MMLIYWGEAAKVLFSEKKKNSKTLL
jgi:hypothetical protein